MRLLANENIPFASVMALRQAGHDVISITERSPGISDEAVLKLASSEQRVVMTFDRDYGELIYHHRLSVPAGVLYMRFTPASPLEPAEYLARLIDSGIILEGRFTTAERDQVRQRPLDIDIGEDE